ncbi:MAG: NnrS family protein [Rubrivivax sp.]|nr:NnrS family protein [Rubrivivax sp.]
MNGPPWLASPFRAFYLLGAGFAVLWMAATAWSFATGSAGPAAHRHAHEMIFGFALAIVVGTALTALPSWAGMAEVGRGPLAGLAAAWAAGRVACAAGDSLPPAVAGAIDLALPALLVALLMPMLARLPRRRWLLLPVLLAGLGAANLLWHVAQARGDAAGAAQAVRLALWPIVVMFSLAGGLLTPVFTANVLRAAGLEPPAPPRLALEVAALLALLALAACDLTGAEAGPTALAATAACVLQAWRVARWRGWRVAWGRGWQPARHGRTGARASEGAGQRAGQRGDEVERADARDLLVLAMHLGFAWLLVALALRGAAAAGAPLPASSWVHAFTVGALGAMMLGLMTRVALRHTGRPAVAPRGFGLWLALASVAAALRVGAPWLGPWAHAAAAAAWALVFAAWLAQHGVDLVSPSLPRVATHGAGGTRGPTPG